MRTSIQVGEKKKKKSLLDFKFRLSKNKKNIDINLVLCEYKE